MNINLTVFNKTLFSLIIIIFTFGFDRITKNKVIETVKSNSKKRKGVHSKNASKSQNGYKTKYRGQGR